MEMSELNVIGEQCLKDMKTIGTYIHTHNSSNHESH